MIAAMAEGTSRIRGLSDGQDVLHTRDAIEHFGARVAFEDDAALVDGVGDRLRPPAADIDCGNSGTGMRLLAGIAATLEGETVLVGDSSLSQRPMDRIAEPLSAMGARVHGHGERCLPPLHVVGGELRGIDWRAPVASAQVKSAILLAGVRARGSTVVRERVMTRAHTEELLAVAGASISVETDGPDRVVSIRPSRLVAFELDVPGDPSQAAFWLVAACIVPGSSVSVRDVYVGAERIGFVSVLQRMGARITQGSLREHNATMPVADITAAYAPLHGTTIHASEIPSLDEVPILAVAAVAAEGTTVFQDVGELRVKESDRLSATADLVSRLGGAVEVDGDNLVVHGLGPAPEMRSIRFDCAGDHRLAMAATIGGLAARTGPTVIGKFDSVDTSYPGFLSDLVALGGTLDREGTPERYGDHARPGMPGRVIAIDGPAGSGKSTVSRRVAAALGLARLDTGAMYRAVTWAALDRGIDLSDPVALGQIAATADLLVDDAQVAIDGADVTGAIRSSEVSHAVSKVAATPGVRRHLVARQRDWATAHGGGVVEGRDIGTVVFPDAELKVYLTASEEERARRRSEESPGGVARRDLLDSTRSASPLTPAVDAVVIDTTDREVGDVVHEVISWI
jgi:3-phosphoshikimate 1-carboxyvinyltransferase